LITFSISLSVSCWQILFFLTASDGKKSITWHYFIKIIRQNINVYCGGSRKKGTLERGTTHEIAKYQPFGIKSCVLLTLVVNFRCWTSGGRPAPSKPATAWYTISFNDKQLFNLKITILITM
jgi:hypothetical protein